jgi:hypothetical protein
VNPTVVSAMTALSMSIVIRFDRIAVNPHDRATVSHETSLRD